MSELVAAVAVAEVAVAAVVAVSAVATVVAAAAVEPAEPAELEGAADVPNTAVAEVGTVVLELPNCNTH